VVRTQAPIKRGLKLLLHQVRLWRRLPRPNLVGFQ